MLAQSAESTGATAGRARQHLDGGGGRGEHEPEAELTGLPAQQLGGNWGSWGRKPGRSLAFDRNQESIRLVSSSRFIKPPMACARNSFNNQPSIYSPASKKSEEISSFLPSKMTMDEVPPLQSIPTINDRGCTEDLFSKMLPIEMQLQVLSRVPVEDLVRHVCIVNRQWRTLTATDAFWRDVASQIFGGQDPWSSLLAEHGTICSSHQLNMFAPADVDDTTKMEGTEGAIDEEDDDQTGQMGLVPNGKMKEVVLYRLRELRVFWPFKSARNLYYCAERGFVHMVESILRDPSKVFQFKKEHIGMAIELATAKGLREVVDVLQPVMRSHTVAEAR